MGFLYSDPNDVTSRNPTLPVERLEEKKKAPIIKSVPKKPVNQDKGFDMNQFMGAIGRFLEENPIKASYSPGVSGGIGSKSAQTTLDTTPLNVAKQVREGTLERSAYTPGKGYTYKKPTTKTAKTWSFNKNARQPAVNYRAKLKSKLAINPKKAKSQATIEYIMANPEFNSQEKYELIKTLDKGLLQMLIEQGILQSE